MMLLKKKKEWSNQNMH